MSFEPNQVKPTVFWLFGLSGAGKSSLAQPLSTHLQSMQLPVLALDGDDLRRGLCRGLGFSDEDRSENLRRAAEAALLAIRSKLMVVASFITPLEEHRDLISQIIGREQLCLIHIDAPLAVCQMRDVKGLYAHANAGRVTNMTGLTSPFEPPLVVDLRIDTSTNGVDHSLRQLVEFATLRLSR